MITEHVEYFFHKRIPIIEKRGGWDSSDERNPPRERDVSEERGGKHDFRALRCELPQRHVEKLSALCEKGNQLFRILARKGIRILKPRTIVGRRRRRRIVIDWGWPRRGRHVVSECGRVSGLSWLRNLLRRLRDLLRG